MERKIFLNKIKRGIGFITVALLALVRIAAVSPRVSASGHTGDANGYCDHCDTQFYIKTEVNGNVRYYTSLADAFDADGELVLNGGKATLLSDVTEEDNVRCVNADVMLDLNGYQLNDACVIIGSRSAQGTLTIIDSSPTKSGRINQGSSGAVFYGGSLVLDGIQFEFAISIFNCDVTIKNCTFFGSDYFSLYGEGGSLTVDGLVCEKRLSFTMIELADADRVSMKNLELKDGIEIDEGFHLGRLLADGYAFSLDGETVADLYTSTLIDGNVKTIEHTHAADGTSVSFDGSNHWAACICGAPADGQTAPHGCDAEGYCPDCSAPIEAMVTNGEDVSYHANMISALTAVEDNGVITLMSDTKSKYYYIDKAVTIDLNGYNYVVDYTLHIKNGFLTLQDSSESGSGSIISYYGAGYSFINLYSGSLTVNSGNVYGCVDLSNSDGASITVNGGSFTSDESVFSFYGYQNSDLTVNGGRFSYDGYFIEEVDGINGEVRIEVLGGEFINGIRNNARPIKEMLADTECGLYIMDENGEEIELEADTLSVDGMAIVMHTGATRTADENEHSYHCEICDLDFNVLPHGELIYTANGEKHNVDCGFCGYDLGDHDHEGGIANCSNKARCKLCNGEYGGYDYDRHVSGKADCLSKAKCSLCQKEYGDIDPNNHRDLTLKSSCDAYDHLKLYTCCGAVASRNAHVGGEATCTEKAVCYVCENPYGDEPKGHKFDNSCDADCSECGAVARTVAPHTFDHGHDAECNTCGEKRTVSAHVAGAWADNGEGKEVQHCIVCGLSMGERDAGLAIGWVIAIVAISAVAFAALTFVVIKFLILPKMKK